MNTLNTMNTINSNYINTTSSNFNQTQIQTQTQTPRKQKHIMSTNPLQKKITGIRVNNKKLKTSINFKKSNLADIDLKHLQHNAHNNVPSSLHVHQNKNSSNLSITNLEDRTKKIENSKENNEEKSNRKIQQPIQQSVQQSFQQPAWEKNWSDRKKTFKIDHLECIYENATRKDYNLRDPLNNYIKQYSLNGICGDEAISRM